MSLALARKYRPRTFAEVAVQSHVSNTLKGAIARGRVAQGYLLCGPRGTGKTTLARVLAMALNCERREAGAAYDGEPCGVCTSCQRIWSGSASLDVVEIDAASNRGVDDARDLRERAMYAPSGEDRYKVYIVDEAHMLTREAWNALLKVLEEPPPRVIFVFATTEPQKIAQTAAPVMSRLQRFDLRRIGPADIRERLAAVLEAEGLSAEPEALAMLARAADGGLRDALSLTNQVLSLGAEGAVTAALVREALGLVPEDEFLALLGLVAERRAADVFPAVERLVDAGVDLGAFLTGLGDMLRAQLAVVLGGAATDVSERAQRELAARREQFAAGDLLRMLTALAELEPSFRRSAQQQLLLETLLVRFALMDRAVELESLLRELGGAGSGGAGSATGVSRPAGATPSLAGAAAPSAGASPSVSASPSVPAAPPVSTPPAAAPAAPAVAVSPPAGRSAPSVSGRPVAPGADAAPTAALAPPRAAREADGPPPWVGPRPWESAGPPSAGGAVAVARPAAGPAAPRGAPDLNRLVERWGDVAAELRREGRVVLATLLADNLPVAVSGAGAVTVEADDAAAAQGLEAGRDALLAAIRTVAPGVERVVVRGSADAAKPLQRLTLEGVREERLTNLRRRDPALDAAIEALDLELLD
jgi:DNA polymerase-3 subunit gamma/tau